MRRIARSSLGRLLALGLALVLMVPLLRAATAAESDRVIGGWEVPQGKYPFLVYVEANLFSCTGSLIAAEWVLTAAHCVVDRGVVFPPALVRVTVGRMDLRNTSVGERVGVVEVVPHPKYDEKTLAYDAALLRLAKAVAQDPIELAPEGGSRYDRPGRRAWVAGWGAVAQRPFRYIPEAQETYLKIRGEQTCVEEWGRLFRPTTMLCASRPPRSTAPGDSGAPLFVEARGGYVQIGIVSFGAAIKGTKPTVFTQISAPEIHQFISETIGVGLRGGRRNVPA